MLRRTVENCLSANEDELWHNGYFLCRGNSLKEFKLRFAHEIDFGSKTTQLGLFDFRSFLNLGMILTTSEKAMRVPHPSALGLFLVLSGTF